MKNKFTFLLAALVALSLFAGCTPKAEPSPAPVVEETPAPVIEATPAPESTESAPVMPATFDHITKDVFGEEQSIKALCAEYEITLVNFWATWCNSCVSKMPDFQNPEDCEKVLAWAGTTYPILKVTKAMTYEIDFSVVPVTIFLDREGNILGDAIVGTRSERQWISELAARMNTVE